MIHAIADLVRALAELALPTYAFVLLWRHQRELPRLLRRLRKGKIFGQELELDQELDELRANTLQATAEGKLPQPQDSGTSSEREAMIEEQVDDVIENEPAPDDAVTRSLERRPSAITRKVLEVAAASPRAALGLLSAEIEGALRELLQSAGDPQPPISPPKAAELLRDYRLIPSELVQAIRSFWRVRNLIVHGGEAEEAEILRAIDSGLQIFQSVRAVSPSSVALARFERAAMRAVERALVDKDASIQFDVRLGRAGSKFRADAVATLNDRVLVFDFVIANDPRYLSEVAERLSRSIAEIATLDYPETRVIGVLLLSKLADVPVDLGTVHGNVFAVHLDLVRGKLDPEELRQVFEA